MENNSHSITIEEQKRIIISGISEVVSFSEKEMKLKLRNGNRLNLFGENFKICGFNKENGNFQADGRLTSMKYLSKDENLLKKVFK